MKDKIIFVPSRSRDGNLLHDDLDYGAARACRAFLCHYFNSFTMLCDKPPTIKGEKAVCPWRTAGYSGIYLPTTAAKEREWFDEG